MWSECWKKYFLENGKAYRAEQLYVSGLLRPLLKSVALDDSHTTKTDSKINVLFISEGLVAPEEALRYLNHLIGKDTIKVTIKFRPSHDGFERWLRLHNPDILDSEKITISRAPIDDAVQSADAVVGSYSTAVLEAFIQLKVPIFFYTEKWGDHYDMEKQNSLHTFFARDPQTLVEAVQKSVSIPKTVLKEFQGKFFGDPTKNGSVWVVDTLCSLLVK